MRFLRDLLNTTRCRQWMLATGLAAFLAPIAPAQTFSQPQIAPTPYYGPRWPASVVGGALQVSGRIDLVAISRGVPVSSPGYPLDSVVYIAKYFNNGAGLLAYNNQSSPEITATSIVATIADFNGDGKQDIAYAASNAMSGFEDLCVDFNAGGGAVDNTQSGCTSLGLIKTIQPHLTYVAALPLTTGGLPQLLLEDSANGFLYIVHNSGASNPTPGALPSFTVKTRYALPPDGAGPISVADLNGDGNLDFVINSQTGNSQTGHSASVYLGNGDGTFQTPVRYSFSHNVHSLLLHDMDGDGHLDMLVEGDNGILEIHRGETNGTFDPASMGGTSAGLDGTTGNGGQLIAVADLNHDGYLDLLTATPAGVSVLLGTGTMTYLPAKIYNAGPGHASYVAADFNSDGNLDLALDSPEGIAILFGNPDGSFQTSRAYAAGQPAMSGALGRFTSSGNLDAIVSTGPAQAQLLLGQGNGTFVAAPAPTTAQPGAAGLWSTIAVGDFNGDGNRDIAITADGLTSSLPQMPAGTVLQMGDGTGHFGAPGTLTPLTTPCGSYTGLQYGNSFVADLNGDGLSDLVVNDRLQLDEYFGAAGATAPGLLYTETSVSCNTAPHPAVAAGDLNNNGHLDVIAQFAAPDLYGHLFIIAPIYTGGYPLSFNADLSASGASTTPGQLTAPLISSTFGGVSPTLGFPAAIESIVVADLDRDGNNDLIVAYDNLDADHTNPVTFPTITNPNYLYIWYGSGSGKFLTSAKHPVNPVRLTPSRNYYQAAVADLNGDGIPDLILSDGYIISIQIGKGDGTFGAETHYLAGQGINSISVGDVNGDGKPDLVLANGGAVLTNPVANLEKLATNPDVNTGGVTVLLNPSTAFLIPAYTLTASPEPSNYGSAFTIKASFPPPTGGTTSPTPTGSVTFFVDGVSLGTASINASGVATIAYAAPNTLSPGTHALTANYSGDATYEAILLSGSHVVSPVIPTGAVTANPEPSVTGTPFELIASINTASGSPVPTGTVIIYVNGIATTSTPLTVYNGSASVPDPSITLPPGTYMLSAVYSGDSVYSSVTLGGTHLIIPAVTGGVTASPEPSTYGSPFVVNGTAPGAGQFVFSVDGIAVGTVTSSSATASVSVAGTYAVGNHTLGLAWTGTQSTLASQFTGTHQVTQNPTTLSLLLCVDPPGSNFPCGTPLSATPLISPITFFFGQSLDGVAIESATNLGGNIVFYDNTNVFCTIPANLTSGANTCPTQSGYFNAGTYRVYATYTGDSNDLPSTSNTIQVNVFADTTSAILTSSANPAVVGTNVTFTYPITGNYATPTGTVNFYDGAPSSATLIGSATLDATGTAAFSTAGLAVGTYTIYAVYNSNPNFAAVQNMITQVITPAVVTPPPPTGNGYTLTITPDPVTVGAGATGILLVTVSGQSSSTPQVALSCSGLPIETTCIFVTPTLPAGGGATTLQLHVTAPHDCGSETPYFIGNESGPASPVPYTFAAVFLGTIAVFRRRKLSSRGKALTLLLLGIALASLASLSGCGHCTDLGTRPGNYTFTVTATPQGTSTSGTESVTVPLTVTIP